VIETLEAEITEAQLKSFFRNVPAPDTPVKPIDGERSGGRQIEITLERETVSVFYPGSMAPPGNDLRCPCCGQAVTREVGCAAHGSGSVRDEAANKTIQGSTLTISDSTPTTTGDEVQQ